MNPPLTKTSIRNAWRDLIAKKIAGQEIVATAAEQQGNVIDLMDALKASIEQAEPPAKPKRGRPKKGA